MITTGNQPAFPEQEFSEEQLVGLTPGLTKREYFAVEILKGLITNANNPVHDAHIRDAIKMADKLVAGLNKPVE